MAGNLPSHDSSAEQVICTCTGTTCGQVYDLHMQGKDLDGISRYTGILTGCGGCEWEVTEFIRALTNLRENQA